MIARSIAVASLFAMLAAPVWAQKAASDHASHHGAAQGQGSPIDGEIRKVDREAKKITIKHGPMPNLDMPAMTMVFQVSDPGMLNKVKPGDKVKFDAQKVSGAYTVTRIDLVK